MEGNSFVETERSNRFSPDVVRHGLDQSSSLSVHQSPLSQQCKHRKILTCDNFVSGQFVSVARFATFEAVYCNPRKGTKPRRKRHKHFGNGFSLLVPLVSLSLCFFAARRCVERHVREESSGSRS